MSKKTCIKCNIEKDHSSFGIRSKYFSKSKNSWTYYPDKICKKCSLEILRTIANKTNQTVVDGKVNWKGVLRNLKKRSKKNNINFDINDDEFFVWLNKTSKTCYYCEIDINLLKKVNNILIAKKIFNPNQSHIKSPRFQIDKKNNNSKIGYTLKNICFACHICNTHKGDFFSSDEFREIAKKFIKPKYLQLKG